MNTPPSAPPAPPSAPPPPPSGGPLPPPPPAPPSGGPKILPFQCPAGVDSAAFFRDRRSKRGFLISTKNAIGHHSLKTLHCVIEGTNMHDAGNERCADIFWYGHSQKRLRLPLNQQNIKQLSPEQRVNWVPSITVMTNKANFAFAYKQLIARRPKTQPFSPAQWILPDESEEFEKHLTKNGAERRIFVVKPSIGSRSMGIELMEGRHVGGAIQSGALSSSWERRRMKLMGRKEQYVAQEYISKLLLMKGHKFDLRLYVVVTSLYPLKVYLYGDGLARVCVSPYRPPEASLTPDQKDAGAGGKDSKFTEQVGKKSLFADWKLCQLTNSSVNKKSSDFDYDLHKLTACSTLLHCLNDRATGDTNAVTAKAVTGDTNAVTAKAATGDTNAVAAKAATGDTNAVTAKAATDDTKAATKPSTTSAATTAAGVSAEHARLWRRIDRVVWDTMVCIRPRLLSSYHGHMHGGCAGADADPTPGLNYNLAKCKQCQQSTGFHCPCFQVIGFDIIVDNALQPWLLEINSDPSLSVNALSKADAGIKKKVVKHCLMMVSALQSGQDPNPTELGNYRVLHTSLRDPLHDDHIKSN